MNWTVSADNITVSELSKFSDMQPYTVGNGWFP